MKRVNPYGRTVSSGLEAHITPRACMCGADGGQYTGARGSSDSCLHCGCDCTESAYSSGNSRNSLTTIHRS
ncbi:Apre_1838 family putative sactipeptide bacteriocin [Dorea formicigenerans]|uniref:Putative bacteriocin n=1 Tax=Dorea formicigenerans TaxID=39486 RepID=A0A3E4M059_9FIRM|nr:Apre_1838 family putative sactipeptide bacteriocin [Dorea formicigenerans]RGK43067.1 putative bacteriocin precursor [Dorea formicigenerans]